MPTSPSLSSAVMPAVAAPLLPIVTLTLIALLVAGLAMPVLPLHVHDTLGMDTVVVGLVTGAQFAAAAAGLLYLLSLLFVSTPTVSTGILLLGVALGISGPVLGWIASGAGIACVFLVSSIVVLCATLVAVWLLLRGSIAYR